MKGGMVRDVLNMAGYMLPDKDDVTVNPSSSSDARYMTRVAYHLMIRDESLILGFVVNIETML